MYQVYVCEGCGKKSSNPYEIEACEAAHMKLSVTEKHTWEALKSSAKYFGHVVSTNNNERTQAAYDNAIDKLVAFEQEHCLS